MTNSPDSRALILMYHRVTMVNVDPFSLCVSPTHFAEHLEVLRRCAQPVRLGQILDELPAGRIPPRSVVVTFDDGYADNFHNARPLLERNDVPATIFVTSGFVGRPREFWWDELEGVFLEPRDLPRSICLTISGVEHRWDIGDFASRHNIYLEIWRLLRPLPEPAREEILDRLARWAARGREARPDYRGLSTQELQRLAGSDLIEIGAHTVTHPSLPDLPATAQRNEIEQSKAELEATLGRPVTSFAWPFGALSAESRKAVREAGFRCACTTEPGFVELSLDTLQLPRIPVEDWDGDEFGKRLRSWLESTSIVRAQPEEPLIGGMWSFHTARGNIARLAFPSGGHERVRIEIEKTATGKTFDIQLNQPGFIARATQTYLIAFSARADTPRNISIGFALAHEPWTGLGLYETVEIAPEWRSFEFRFRPKADAGNARIHFDLGGSGSSIDLAAVAIRALPENEDHGSE